jgi:membrane protein YqaA with SNARE-associated domain
MDSGRLLLYQGAAGNSWDLMFERLYRRVLSLAESDRAPSALAAIAFAESSFFPIPPDVILIPMSLARPKQAWRYAAICTIASVAGGMLGYAIGALLFDTIGRWLIDAYGYGERMAALQEAYARWGALVILLKGLTPIPYKLVTIVSGLLGYNFVAFVLLSTLTRGARFFIVAGVLNRFGDPLRVALERHFAVFLGIIAATIVAGFWVATRVF